MMSWLYGCRGNRDINADSTEELWDYFPLWRFWCVSKISTRLESQGEMYTFNTACKMSTIVRFFSLWVTEKSEGDKDLSTENAFLGELHAFAVLAVEQPDFLLDPSNLNEGQRKCFPLHSI